MVYFVELIPITIAGLGTRELAVIFFLNKIGYNKEEAILLTTVLLLFILINIFIGLLCWLIKPVKMEL